LRALCESDERLSATEFVKQRRALERTTRLQRLNWLNSSLPAQTPNENRNRDGVTYDR
jgi:hypothetical protein